jgi:hypothetical protein
MNSETELPRFIRREQIGGELKTVSAPFPSRNMPRRGILVSAWIVSNKKLFATYLRSDSQSISPKSATGTQASAERRGRFRRQSLARR